ncbi:MAG: hypothetical protein HPAVJP_2730 [Candidatus Hepatoplasma vulgare]|nr:MAG: hypothetical protein HPAVJP_2730 [Candidatus Hepatoplasma sp.]
MEEKNRNFILISFWKKIRNIIIIFFIILCMIFIFLRYTGIISSVFWDWKKPDVSLISNDNTPSFYQNNDQLWVNIDFNTHHSNIKEANVWMQETETKDASKIQNQELKEDANTYIFKNISTGSEDEETFYIYYEIEWSLWGKETGELGSYTMHKSSNIDIEVESKSEEDMTISTNRNGEFYTIGEIAPNVDSYFYNKSSAALYFINEDSISNINKIKETDIITLATKANKFLNDKNRKEDYENVIDNILDVIIYQFEIPDGINDYTFNNVKTSNYDLEKTKNLTFDDQYLMIGAGIAKNTYPDSENDEPWFLTFSKPFYADIYGIPFIQSSAYFISNDDLQINTLINDNNYDKSENSYIHYTVYVQEEDNIDTFQYLTDAFLEINSYSSFYTYYFYDIVHNDICLNLISLYEPNSLIFTVQTEMWYGSDLTPVYDSISGGNYDSFKHSEAYTAPQVYYGADNNYLYSSNIHYGGLTFDTLYNTTNPDSPYALTMRTENIWRNDEGNVAYNPNAKIDIYYSLNNSEPILFKEDVYDILCEDNTYVIFNNDPTPNDDLFFAGDEIEIYLDTTIFEYDWFGDLTGEISANYIDEITYTIPFNN